MAEGYVCLDVVFEVLLRVPATHVGRMREVSPLWRFTIESSVFRDAHRRRRSPMLLVFCRRDFVSTAHGDMSRVELLEFDADEGEPRRLLRFAPVQTPPALQDRFPGLRALGAAPDSLFRVEGCFGGVVLVSYGDSLYACNPCSRRWSRLPPIHLHRSILGLYASAAAGPGEAAEWRVLFFHGFGAYGVLHLGSRVTRDIGRPTIANSPPELDVILRDGFRQDYYDEPPVFIDRYLYWRPQLEEQDLRGIAVFDTRTELFAWLDAPALKAAGLSQTVDIDMLFEIEGKLAAATIDSTVQVWVRERGMWIPRHRLLLPAEEMAAHLHLIEGMTTPGRIFIASARLDILIQLPQAVLHADRTGSILGFHQDIIATPYLLQSHFSPEHFLPGSGEDQDECSEPVFFDFGGRTRSS